MSEASIIMLKDIIGAIEATAPPALQESYDNSGLQAGSRESEITGALICIDITEKIVEEAIDLKLNLIISHHPLIFPGIKSITEADATGRILRKAIKNDIALYSAHTNLDSISGGVSSKLADKLGLINQTILEPRAGRLVKLVTFVPNAYADKVRQSLFDAGAGKIGNYDSCSYNITGEGTFKAGDNTNPFAGAKGVLHKEAEVRIETIFPDYLESSVVQALLCSHPYEEAAYDLYPLKNKWMNTGFGVVGNLNKPMPAKEFLTMLKQLTNSGCIRHTEYFGKDISRVAVCGGSGSSLLKEAIRSKADIFVSADFKYHQFFDSDNKIIIADIGHYESEQFTKELFFEIVTKNFPNFAVHLSKVNSNPIKYL